MPNWVTNKVSITPSNIGREILDKIIIVNDKKNECFDFNKILPMPKTMNITSGGYDIVAMQYVLSKLSDDKIDDINKKLRNTKADFYGNYYDKIYKNHRYNNEELEVEAKEFKEKLDNNRFNDFLDNVDYKELGINNLEDYGNIYINNILQYGVDSWFDWSCKYWGTKWNSTQTYRLSDNEVEFETAWCCPVAVLQELSKQNKDIRIKVEFADEDIGNNCGTIIIKNGEVIKEVVGDKNFAMKMWGHYE